MEGGDHSREGAAGAAQENPAVASRDGAAETARENPAVASRDGAAETAHDVDAGAVREGYAETAREGLAETPQYQPLLDVLDGLLAKKNAIAAPEGSGARVVAAPEGSGARVVAAPEASGARVIVAIEGGSASGKTTLGKWLQGRYGCTVFHMDDFFLRPEQRTQLRLAQPGGNIDWERFLEEVLMPLGRGETVSLRRFDCSTLSLAEAERIIPTNLVIVEGAYSMHPQLAAHYDFSAFLDITPQLQRERILRRNTKEKAQQFFRKWIPLENIYFEKTGARERCDMVIPVL